MSSHASEPPVPASALDNDPETGRPWPRHFDTGGTAHYIQIFHNLPIAKLTLVRQRTRGVGIRWKYLGQKPVAERIEIDRFVAEDALRDVSPLKAGAQARAARERKQQQRQKVKQPPGDKLPARRGR
jgi:hypothetical protein